MTEVTFKGEPIHLKGQQINGGDFTPGFTVLDNDLNQVTLADYTGKKKLTSVVPSIDTGVCGWRTRKFNSEASKGGEVVLTISTSLPFTRKRWCASTGLDNVITLSDHRDLSFGGSYGAVMEELRLLARAIFVLDAGNKAVYKEIISKGTDFPGFDAALTTCKNIQSLKR